ncbi:PP2C family protein-serine/threonine phosphatase [Grimontia sp. NTOU-MAR1]|uniref:PP2C family protein-serine/threonine phosphatase n=1 Tax=Grimontia sp. NTOU-MAR1 TaxID=3111011 RepID=UPI002DB58A6E|nr:protein phosphatase 2C domain-containing protein [Grimontia sp. NTOU-MAR1]WRV98566.1 protein phosphatase 2C domain-containing protein [Grimontia sp. NTOU-MAR1]
MFQQLLLDSLSREVLNRGLIHAERGSIALASDQGLNRSQNQDKALSMKFSQEDEQLFLLALADGMGGMRDGKRCAELALAAFCSSILESDNNNSLLSKALIATEKCNQTVFEEYRGNGGCTLSAILVSNLNPPVTINVGDSRIYGQDKNKKLIRLSIDDSLAEAVGGVGTELLQFIGMGDGIRAHITELDEVVERVYLTSDGVHYIEPKTLSQIVENSDNVVQVVERLLAIARWCGSPDNATICAIDLQLLNTNEREATGLYSEVIDPFGRTIFPVISHTDKVKQQHLQVSPVVNDSNQKQDESNKSECEENIKNEEVKHQLNDDKYPVKKESVRRTTKRKKSSSRPKVAEVEDFQLTISTCDHSDRGTDEDS